MGLSQSKWPPIKRVYEPGIVYLTDPPQYEPMIVYFEDGTESKASSSEVYRELKLQGKLHLWKRRNSDEDTEELWKDVKKIVEQRAKQKQ